MSVGQHFVRGSQWAAVALLALGPLPDYERLEPAVRALVREVAAEVDAAPDSAAAHGRLGLVFEANNLWSEAHDCFSRAAELDPQEALWRFHLALAAQETGDTASLELFRDVVAARPELAAARQRLGHELLRRGDLTGAREQFAALVELEPNLPQGYAGVAETLLRERDFAGAAELLERAIRIDAGYGVSHYLLGLAYRGLGRSADAERELALGVGDTVRYLPDPLSEEVRRYAVNLSARLNEAGRLLSQNRAADAASLLEQALDSSPGSLEAMNNLAIAYMRQGRLEPARALLLRAREADADKISTYLNLVSCALRMRRAAEALQWADAAVERAPELGRVHASRSGVLAAMGRTEEALVAAERAAGLDPGNQRFQFLVAELTRRVEAQR